MISKALKIFLIIFGFFLFANLLVLDFFTFRKKPSIALETKPIVSEETKVASSSCELTCQEYIKSTIKEELGKMPSLAGQSSVSQVPAKIVAPTAANGKTKVEYVPLISEGSVSSVTWTDIVPSEFYFNLADYPGAKEVRFQAYILSLNNDLVTARLYDQTNKRAIDFSDLQTSNSVFTRVESSPITIWRGNNKYTVQLRSVNGTQVQLKEAKLKIVY